MSFLTGFAGGFSSSFADGRNNREEGADPAPFDRVRGAIRKKLGISGPDDHGERMARPQQRPASVGSQEVPAQVMTQAPVGLAAGAGGSLDVRGVVPVGPQEVQIGLRRDDPEAQRIARIIDQRRRQLSGGFQHGVTMGAGRGVGRVA